MLSVDAPWPTLTVQGLPMPSTSFRPRSGSWDGRAGENPAATQGPGLPKLRLELSWPRDGVGKWSWSWVSCHPRRGRVPSHRLPDCSARTALEGAYCREGDRTPHGAEVLPVQLLELALVPWAGPLWEPGPA